MAQFTDFLLGGFDDGGESDTDSGTENSTGADEEQIITPETSRVEATAQQTTTSAAPENTTANTSSAEQTTTIGTTTQTTAVSSTTAATTTAKATTTTKAATSAAEQTTTTQSGVILVDITTEATATTGTTAPTYANAANIVNPNYESPYYIVVYAGESQSVAIYTKDAGGKYSVLSRCFTCSTGAPGSPTRTGQYKIRAKYRWRWLVGDVYGQYSSSISSSYLFHSVPYFTESENALDMTEYDKLGTQASHGCIRLCVRDTKWIYDNCPIGTQVNIVNKSGPAGAGVPSLNYDSKYKGWDPSDPHKDNPYK